MKKLLLLTLSVLLLGCTALLPVTEPQATASPAPIAPEPKAGTMAEFEHGSAETPGGTTLVVSVFADDRTCSWDMTRDRATVDEVRRILGVTEAFVESLAASYGVACDLVTDFEKHPDLLYTASFDRVIGSDGNEDMLVWQYLDTLDVDALLAAHGAQHCVFYVFLNTEPGETRACATRSWFPMMPYPYEFVYLYVRSDDMTNGPAIYTHELFHAFGAPDYYMSDLNYNITDATVAYFQRNLSTDLMLTCTDPYTGTYNMKHVTNSVSELTAFFIGLTDRSELYDKLELLGCEHIAP